MSVAAVSSYSAALAANSTRRRAIFEQYGDYPATPLRMEADERFRGRGVTIAFLIGGLMLILILPATNRIRAS